MQINIIGLGFVGGSMLKSFQNKIIETEETGITVSGYDKYKNGGIGCFENCMNADILFLALPTLFDEKECKYKQDPIHETCKQLVRNDFQGVIVVKSTVEPTSVNELSQQYPLHFIHNPEFLTARQAYEDFHNQHHIVLGKGNTCPKEKVEMVREFYQKLYTSARVSLCNATEAECMKIFLNTFYATKVQMFTEFYLLSKKLDIDFETVRTLMIKNNWINAMHTRVPGPDGQISYGGLCFPKDTNALLNFMKEHDTPHDVLEAVINERNKMRKDHDNVIKK